MIRARNAPLAFLAALALTILPAGCSSMAMKQEARVDAITSTTSIARGASYLISVRNTELLKEAGTHAFALAVVNAALEGKGQFAAPPRTDPQYLLEIDYGVGSSIQQAYSGPIQEKFLTLSARDFVRSGRGEELWNIRVVVTEAGASLEHALPLLAVVALDHAGTDTQGEITVKVPLRSPSVARIRAIASEAVRSSTAAP